MAAVAAGMDPGAPVATCPGWTVARLVKHTGIVHRWAESIVATRASARIEQRDLEVGLPAAEASYPRWLAAGADVKRLPSELEAAFVETRTPDRLA